MKRIVIYTSKYGASRKTAERLKKEGIVSRCVDLADEQSINFEDCSMIVLGGGIYMGQLNKKIVVFLKKYEEELQGKEIVLYIHGLISETNYKTIICKAVGKFLERNKLNTIYLGGELDTEQLGFVNRVMLKEIAKENNLDPLQPNTISEEAYQKLVMLIKK